MRISDGSSDVCSSDLVCDHRGSWHGPSSDRLGIGVGGEAVAHALPLLAVPAIPLGTAGDIRDGHGAGLVELTGELAVDGVRPARGGDLVTGPGVARCLTSPVPEGIAVTPRQRHNTSQVRPPAVHPPSHPAPPQARTTPY